MGNHNIPPQDADASSATKLPTAAADHASKSEHSMEQTDRISARAHFKSQHRTGSGAGNADNDWLEAEREIDSATKGERR
jgi:hypothetical protein